MKKLVPEDSVLIPDVAERVYRGLIHDVYHWQQKMFDGSFATFEMLRRADTTAVICVVDGKILVLDDEQPNRGPRKSFPGGRVDTTDADILEAAKREVLEEAGYTFKNWRLVEVEQPQTKIEWFVHTFIAWDGQQVAEPQSDAGERITVNHLSFDEVKHLALEHIEYLDESALLFERLSSIEALLSLPEYKGKEIERD